MFGRIGSRNISERFSSVARIVLELESTVKFACEKSRNSTNRTQTVRKFNIPLYTPQRTCGLPCKLQFTADEVFGACQLPNVAVCVVYCDVHCIVPCSLSWQGLNCVLYFVLQVVVMAHVNKGSTLHSLSSVCMVGCRSL